MRATSQRAPGRCLARPPTGGATQSLCQPARSRLGAANRGRSLTLRARPGAGDAPDKLARSRSPSHILHGRQHADDSELPAGTFDAEAGHADVVERAEEAPKQTKTFRRKADEPWNKGRTMSVETRQKMSAAKTGRRMTVATRRKMSIAQSERPLPRFSREAAERISAANRGKPKSPAHRRAIASAQRKRRAAVRVLAAVEQKGKPSLSLSYDAAAKRSRRRGAPTRKEVLDSYKSVLREYRHLQAELKPWTEAFIEKNGRKPSLLGAGGGSEQSAQIMARLNAAREYKSKQALAGAGAGRGRGRGLGGGGGRACLLRGQTRTSGWRLP
eukprot:jgi/Tetstr1/457515/TSEL_044096.t1